MSAGKNRQTCHSYQTLSQYQTCQSCQTCQTYQSPRLPLNAVVISAVARADLRCAPHPSLGLHSFIGAALGCQATPGTGGGAETPGVSTR